MKPLVVLDSLEEIDFETVGEIKYKVIELDSTGKKVETNKMMQRLELKRDIKVLPDFDKHISYNKAIEFINSRDFTSDSSLNGLLESRDPNGGSVTEKETLKTELTSEYNELLEFSAGLKVMGDVFKLNMGFSKKFKSIKKVNLDMKIYF